MRPQKTSKPTIRTNWEKMENRVNAFYRNKDGKINNTTFREIKEQKKTNQITEILTTGGDRIRNNTEI